MRNLFVVHSQNNLILASGLANNDFKSDINDLILFRDFKPSENLDIRIKKCFSSVKIIEGIWDKPRGSIKDKLKRSDADCKEIKIFVSKTKYHRLFIVDDACVQEMFLMKLTHKNNPGIEMAWLEDGAYPYFTNDVPADGLGATPLRRLIRRIAVTVRYGLYGYYDLHRCMGIHKLLKKVYLTYPKYAREEYGGQERIEISDQTFNTGMNILYVGDIYEFESGSILIALDKLDVYGEKLREVDKLITQLVEKAHRENRKVYYKYHPRENDRLPALSNEVELNRSVALEGYLVNSTTRDMTVIGIKSTSLQTAKKMGYNVCSYIQLLEPENIAVLNFYNNIEITCM